MAIKLELRMTGASGTKTWTIPNPIDVESFDADDAKDLASKTNSLLGSNVSLAKATYITTTENVVFPAA